MISKIKSFLLSHVDSIKFLRNLIALFFVYVLAGRLGLAANALNTFASLVWAPSGIALASLLILGLRLWPAVFAGAYVVNILSGASEAGSLGIAIGNTLEAVIGYQLCARVSFDNSLSRLKDVFSLITRASIFSTLVSASIGVFSLWATGALENANIEHVWLQWWVGDALSDLTVAPLILVYSTPAIYRRFAWSHNFVMKISIASLAVTLTALFLYKGTFGPQISSLFSGFMILPFILWAAMSFGQRGAVIANFVLCSIVVFGAAMNKGPFVGATPISTLWHLMIFMVATCLIGLVVAAVVTERELEKSNLEKSMAHATSILNTAMDCIISMNHLGQIVEFNPAAEKTFGYKREEIIGRNMADVIIAEDFREVYRQDIARYIESGQSSLMDKRLELYATRKDNSLFPVELSITRIPLSVPPQFMSYIRDISERKQNEEAIKQSYNELEKIVQIRTAELYKTQERFRSLVEVIQDYAIIMLNPNGYITTWNVGAERMTGYTATEVLGKHFSIFYPPEAIEINFPDTELKTAKNEGRFENEGLRVRKDGSTYLANVIITPIYDKEGQLTGFSKVSKDITERIRAAERMQKSNEELERRVEERTHELARSETQLRNIANAMPVFVAHIDANEKFLFANESCRRWFMNDDETMIGKHFKEIMSLDRYKEIKVHIDKALSGQITTFEREAVKGNLKAIFLVTLVPEFDETLEVVRFILTATDITNQKSIERELVQARDAANAANEAKSAFLANMSHEIRTPLGAVLGFSELLISTDLTASDRVNSVEAIKRNGKLLSNIINDILDLSKVEAGKLDVERTPVQIQEVLNDLNSLLSLEASEKGLRFSVSTDGQIPLAITTDTLRLKQILFNIVGNAIKFTQKGSVEVVIKMEQNPSGATIKFVVKDTGPGISAENAERLFAPFMQADVSTTRKFGGTGLGLVLSKKLANILGGDVELTTSELGKGSTFTISIAAGEVQMPSAQQSTQPPPTLSVGTPQLQLENLNILLVDDSPDNQALVGRFLKAAKAHVQTASNGAEAVEKALHGKFNLVLMDLQMPEMDGYEAMDKLKKAGYKTPVIALTAHAMQEERARCLSHGFVEHVSKPVDRNSLIQTVAAFANT